MGYKLKYTPYTPESLAAKKKILTTLNERERRLFISQEYLSLGKGSQRYVSEVFCLHRNSIIAGVKELQEDCTLPTNAQRRKGGGRKKKNT
jgi:transposase